MAERVLSEDEVAARMPLWCALSDLFLDTQPRRQDYEAIARTAREGGFSEERVRDILEREVFPAFAFNLMSIAGEWTGFDPGFVRERILRTLKRPRVTWFLSGGARKQFLAREWPRVRAAMDGQEPDLLEVTVEPDPPILVVGIGVLVIVGALALVLGRL